MEAILIQVNFSFTWATYDNLSCIPRRITYFLEEKQEKDATE